MQLQSVAPEDAAEMQASGDWVLVDVRPSKDFTKASVQGAESAPLFQGISMQSVNPVGLLRAAAYALNGVAPVEPNLAFSEDVKKASGGKNVILVWFETSLYHDLLHLCACKFQLRLQ